MFGRRTGSSYPNILLPIFNYFKMYTDFFRDYIQVVHHHSRFRQLFSFFPDSSYCSRKAFGQGFLLKKMFNFEIKISCVVFINIFWNAMSLLVWKMFKNVREHYGHFVCDWKAFFLANTTLTSDRNSDQYFENNLEKYPWGFK